MSPRTECPACHSLYVASFLASPEHQVDYFRCANCHHIWNVPKSADGPVNHVTPLPEPSVGADKLVRKIG